MVTNRLLLATSFCIFIQKMRQIYIFLLVILVVVVYSFPAEEHNTSDRETVAHRKGKEYDPEGEDLSMFKLKELVDCYKKQGLDPGNLPNIDDISEEDQKVIFDSCNHFFNLPAIAVMERSHQSKSQDNDLNRRQEKRSGTRRSTNRRASKATRRTKTPMNPPPTIIPTPSIGPSQPIDVRVTFDELNLIREVLRLQFLFFNSFFSSLSACISTEDIELSVCLLDSFSAAFSVLSIELSENE